MEPTWTNAKALLADLRELGRKGSETYILLGKELFFLREKWKNQGQRTDLSHFGTSAQIEPNHRKGSEPGWQERVQTELGISKATANRYIEDYISFEEIYRIAAAGTEIPPELKETAEYYIDQIMTGEMRAGQAREQMSQQADVLPPLTNGDGVSEGTDFEPIPHVHTDFAVDERWDGIQAFLLGHKRGPDWQRFLRMQWSVRHQHDKLAADNLERVLTGAVTIARAYAGWCGGRATEGKTRKDPDYGKLLPKSASTLQSGWKKWYELPAVKREEFQESWLTVVETMPEELRIATMALLLKRGARSAASNSCPASVG